jgi:hypothetical protein
MTPIRYYSFLLLLWSIPAQAQIQNILVGNKNAPEEVSICINPKNHLQMTAGANLDNYYYSSDGGLTWTGKSLVSVGNGVYGDPCVFTDTAGNFYFMHLSNPPPGAGSWVDRIVCQRSTDGGQTYNNGSYTGLNGTKVQDKHWTAVNQATNEIYVCWTQFDVYGSHNPQDSSVILFSKSSDNAATWSTPLRISRQAGDCIDSDSTVEGAVPCLGPQGQLYVAWTGPQGLVFNKSLDDGASWLAHETPICSVPGGWDYNISGLYRCNGLPATMSDLSPGPHRGTIYVNWSDQRNGTTDTDIWLVQSQDEGKTWSVPKRVNSDAPGKQNFMSWMSIDQTNGDLYIVYYDRRNRAAGSDTTDVYLARSTDGGQSFTDFRISQNAFVPKPGIFFGDYIGISAHGGMVRPIWMQYDGTVLSAWTAIVDAAMLGIAEEAPLPVAGLRLDQNSPNPFTESTVIHFDLKDKCVVTLYISDLLGRRVAVLYQKQKMDKGGHEYVFNAKAAGIPAGLYEYTLESDSSRVTRKMNIAY